MSDFFRHLGFRSALCILFAVSAASGAVCQVPGAATGAAILPDTVNFVPPADAHVVNDCVKLLAPDLAKPPKGVCVLFPDAGIDAAIGSTDRLGLPSPQALMTYAKAMGDAGWKFAHLAVTENYYERPRPGTDCSDIAVLLSLPRANVATLVAADPSIGSAVGQEWRGYFIRDELGEACGAQRKARPAG